MEKTRLCRSMDFNYTWPMVDSVKEYVDSKIDPVFKALNGIVSDIFSSRIAAFSLRNLG